MCGGSPHSPSLVVLQLPCRELLLPGYIVIDLVSIFRYLVSIFFYYKSILMLIAHVLIKQTFTLNTFYVPGLAIFVA